MIYRGARDVSAPIRRRTALTAEATLLWRAYKRGEAATAEKAGRDAAQAESQARIEQLARELAETRAELATLQSKRRRVS